MLDAHANEALGNSDGVFGDELLEGDKEAGLDGDTTGDGCVSIHTVSDCCANFKQDVTYRAAPEPEMR